jgi:predicted RNase H-like HicB family nuclease
LVRTVGDRDLLVCDGDPAGIVVTDRHTLMTASAAEEESMAQHPRTVHVPYTLECDEDGMWCAHAWLGSSGGANGNGATPEEAVADLREAVQMVLAEDGVPEQLEHTLDLEVA